jgi:hypothetical protein
MKDKRTFHAPQARRRWIGANRGLIHPGGTAGYRSTDGGRRDPETKPAEWAAFPLFYSGTGVGVRPLGFSRLKPKNFRDCEVPHTCLARRPGNLPLLGI